MRRHLLPLFLLTVAMPALAADPDEQRADEAVGRPDERPDRARDERPMAVDVARPLPIERAEPRLDRPDPSTGRGERPVQGFEAPAPPPPPEASARQVEPAPRDVPAIHDRFDRRDERGRDEGAERVRRAEREQQGLPSLSPRTDAATMVGGPPERRIDNRRRGDRPVGRAGGPQDDPRDRHAGRPVQPDPASLAATFARPDSHRRWRDEWRRDKRHDWRRHRDRNRWLFRFGYYHDPFGYGYRRPAIGWRLWPGYYRDPYWLRDPWTYRLPLVSYPYRWVRYWDDAVLVDVRTGRVLDVIHDFFW